ncbi:MAG: 3-methyl-2-oxobutanoate hydroxymethyltransferase [Gammaproteobacteria bacterium]
MIDKLTLPQLRAMKSRRERIVSLTAYDAGFARVLDRAGIEVLLVGDSLGMVLHGADDTLGVTMNDMVYHSRLVAVAAQRALVVTDMPYMTYTTPAQALANAQRLLRQGRANVVKLEGGETFAPTIALLTKNHIPVCAHLGLLPQSIREYGGYHMQGRDSAGAAQILADAKTLAQAGAVMLVLECVPASLAAKVTVAIDIPVIGIGAGADCDGQVLVLQDLLGISVRQPRFARNFLAGQDGIEAAVRAYINAVKQREFPGPEHTPAS